MNGLPEFREYCLSRTSLNSILAKSPQPRKSVDTPRRTGGTSMDDLVPQRPQRRSSKRPPAVSNSPQSTVQSPPNMSHAHQSMPQPSTLNADYTPYNNSSRETQPCSVSSDGNTPEIYTGAITPNASSSTANSKQRSRDAAVDSLTSVKFKPMTINFEDLKSEAINFWDEGVDVKLVDAKSKKKTEWLSSSAFFSTDPMMPSSSSSANNNSNDMMTSDSDANQTADPPKQTYAGILADKAPSAADRQASSNALEYNAHPPSSSTRDSPSWAKQADYMPAWASVDNSSNNRQSYSNHTAAWMPQNGVHPMPHMAPVVMMPSSFIPIPASGYHQASPYATSPTDREWMHCFYSVITKFNIRAVVNSFQKKIDGVLQRSLQDLSPRSFGLLLQALTVVMEYEANLSVLETARKINTHWTTFIFYFVRFTKTYATLPDDIKVILQFSVTMSRFFPKIYQDLPMDDILRIYEHAKSITNQDMNAEFLKQLRLLKAISMDGSGHHGSTNGDLDYSLPSLPAADKVVTEVIDKVNSLRNYEIKKEMTIANKLHNPWPNLDLTNYTLFHFLMLRDEFVGPVQTVIKELFKGSFPVNISVPECAVYEKTLVVSSTLSFQTSDPCIVFKLGPAVATEHVVSDFEEGSLVMVMPEKHASVSPSDQHAVKKQVAEISMMGQAVRAHSCYTPSGQQLRLVSIHIDRDDIHKLDLNSRYTIISCKNNANATKAVLKWLYNEHLKLEKKHWSSVLTPRVLAAKNILSQAQITCWDKENHEQAVMTNDDTTPDYLATADIDISCIMTRTGNYRARPGQDIWPAAPTSHLEQSMSAARRLPLYNLSPSQLKAVKFALTHRIAAISGPPGTGKTFLASKLAQLMSEALTAGQFHQPILIIAKTQSCLDDILKPIVQHIPDMVRFGSEPYDDVLKSKQATQLAAPAISDNNYRQFQMLERQLTSYQAKLLILLQERAKIVAHCPAILSSAVPPPYLSAMNKAYSFELHHSVAEYQQTHDMLTLWNCWASQDKLTQTYHKTQLSCSEWNHAQWNLENSYLKRGGRGIMPMLDPNMIRARFTHIASNPPQILSLSDAVKWPFDSSTGTGARLRSSIMQVWRRVPADQVWHLDDDKKTQLIDSLVKVLLSAIDAEVEDILQQQLKAAQSYDEILIQKWTYLCRFNRIIGMTADFAAANREWVSTLWPRGVIVDEASEILESTIASTALGPRTEHLILLGTSDNLFKPRITNPALAGNPRNFDVSLFERWKGSNSEMTLMEEQWRMHSDVASIIDKFNCSKKTTESSSLITAPMITYNENMVDGKNPRMEVLKGITQRAYYVDYQSSEDTEVDNFYSKLTHTQINKAEVDEAHYVASLAVYLSQQDYPTTGIVILTVSIVQKYLIRHILREEIPKRTCFTKNIAKIHLDTIEQYTGRQNNFAIVSTATPGHSSSSYDNITRALTRARYGLYIVGKPGKDRVHRRWDDFANFMKKNELFGPAIQLTCATHGDSLYAGHWKDLLKMKNGGCQQLCDTLMDDGHACKEECHFGGHDQVICQEPCIRIRPSNCTHACKKKCFECSKNGACPPCSVETEVHLKCGHTHVGICHELQNLDRVECQEQVPYVFECQHQTMIKCCQLKTANKMTCPVQTEVQLPCGHTVMSRCGVEPVCTHVCDGVLDCGHKCHSMCGEPHSHDRSECTASCSKQLICGHQCAKGCRNPDDHTERCTEKCNYVCSHGYKCSRECYKDCIRCISECPYICKHYKCTKKCFEICDRPPCNNPCNLVLKCSHTCSGLCGEPCPPCVTCHGDLQCSITLRTLSEFEENEKVYMLPECGCVFSAEALDMYFKNQAKNGEHTAVKVWGCPSCQKTIYMALRYNQYVKTEINLVNKIKMRLEKERQQLSPHEKEQIVSAMNDETRQHAIHNMVGGRWFVCENQHPYYVGDCGGATEVSKCPECDAPIGGTQHKVVESNRFYGEFDGSEKPAWPGQPGADA
ncbi:hypothetical protein HMPREF1544_02144 [Mucor circinelloides 1006PhL]|uniref:RZ-type domain-containing protein n=1 Tax=Mucor circinelloides f. circinelloides (strain 1006PhL) TaxID=1220926 RepID=S2KFE4_MUCC1|nr:hypothetical protein HMPREF1544_02144 [Mucor circinelloides 1006PhL]